MAVAAHATRSGGFATAARASLEDQRRESGYIEIPVWWFGVPGRKQTRARSQCVELPITPKTAFRTQRRISRITQQIATSAPARAALNKTRPPSRRARS